MTGAPESGSIPAVAALEIRVRGRVQGVGFRPFVWRQARALGLSGHVLNDGEGVLIRAAGGKDGLAALIERIEREPPPMASVASIAATPYAGELPPSFDIVASGGGIVETEVAPDAVMCADCAAEIRDPASRRYRYPFTTCTNCGPRLTIVSRMPYDRANTSMAPFELCGDCAAEYADPADRRFHAETTACPVCGPRLRLIRLAGRPDAAPASLGPPVTGSDGAVTAHDDPVAAAARLIATGEIVAVKGLGGYHLACDAASASAVARLRAGKHRDRKPFALMARNVDVIRRYARVSAEEEALLAGPAGPIVLLEAAGSERLPDGIAPGLALLGFMLPTTPLHALLVEPFDTPLVMTSGNISERPQVIRDADAHTELAGIAAFALVHDRDILNRVDDSVIRMAGDEPRPLRRARGFAPAPIGLPAGLHVEPPILALGGDLKNAFCLLHRGSAVLSQHIGDLDDPATEADLLHTVRLYREMLDVTPRVIAADLHPGYRSTAVARRLAAEIGAPVIEIQHHHAHIASCLAENRWPVDGRRVLGIALDGLGYGSDGSIWGGELLLADYRGFERLGALHPVAMIGGDKASREPWRNLYAHLVAAFGWNEVESRYGGLDVVRALAAKPRGVLDAMLRARLNSPLASSCGRLFDAVAAALGLCFERQGYEGEAASLVESAVIRGQPGQADPGPGYPFAVEGADLLWLDPRPMWQALLDDLARGASAAAMAARFHDGLAAALAGAAVRLRHDRSGAERFDTVALSGGCFNNRVLLEALAARLRASGFAVLDQSAAPAGDGGLALGQAAVAAALAGNA